MLTIQNIETLIHKAITIKGYTFVIGNVLTSPNEYRIVIEDIGTVHAPIILLLTRNEATFDNIASESKLYQLRKYGSKPTFLYKHAMKNPIEFMQILEMYLNSL